MQVLHKNHAAFVAPSSLKSQSKSPLHKKMSGIPSVIAAPLSLTNMKVIDARTTGFFHPYPSSPPKVQSKKWRDSFLKSFKEIPFINHWIIQEFWFAMNKLSIFGLMMGLMFLGALFFAVGFLVAYKTFPESPKPPTQTWAQASQSAPPQSKNGERSDLSRVASRAVAEKQHEFLANVVSRVEGTLGIAQSKIPAPLQPFANYAANRVHTNAVGGIYAASRYSRQEAKKFFQGQVAQPPSSPMPPQNPQNGPYQGQNQLPPQTQHPLPQGYAPPAPPHPSMPSQIHSHQQMPQPQEYSSGNQPPVEYRRELPHGGYEGNHSYQTPQAPSYQGNYPQQQQLYPQPQMYQPQNPAMVQNQQQCAPAPQQGQRYYY